MLWVNTLKIAFFKKNLYLLLSILIVIIAAFIRLYRISDYMTFLGDEGRDVLVVKHILEGHLTFLGPRSSAGDFFMGPIYYYLITPFLWLFNFNPVGPAVMVALFGIVTVYFVYYVGKYFFDEKAGLIASMLYAISPLVIAYSRSSWNPNIMPFFCLLSIFLTYKAVKENQIKFFILIGFLLGIAIQLHYITLFLIVILTVYLLFANLYENGFKKITALIKNYSLILVGFIVGFSPFLVFEVRHGFPNIKTILKFILLQGTNSEYKEPAAPFFSIVSDVFTRLFARLAAFYPPLEQTYTMDKTQLFVWKFLTLLLAFISIILIFKIKDKLKVALFSLWLFLGVFLFGFYKKPIYDYNLVFMFPLPFLLIGNTLSFFMQKKSYLLKTFSIICFVSLIYVNLLGFPFLSEPNRQLEQVKKISKFVFDKADSRPFNFALITGGNSDHAYRYFFELWKNSPVTIENVQNDPERKTATDQLLVVCESIPCEPVGNSLWEVAGFGRAEIVGEWNVSVVKVYKLVHYKEN